MNKQNIQSPYGDILVLPQDLQSENVVHIEVTTQGHDECGFHTAFNALAVQDLVNENKKVTSQDIQQKAKKLHDRLENKELEVSEIITLHADELGLKNTYFVSYNKTNNQVSPAGVTADVKCDLETSIQNLINTKQNNSLHIICNTGGHWVLFSIIKDVEKYGDKPLIIYMDSNNNELHEGSAQKGFAKYFIDMIKNLETK